MVQTKCGFDTIPGGANGADLLMLNALTLLVNIGFDPSYNPQVPAAPVLGSTSLPALVDTGAAESCIDNLLATALKLPSSIEDQSPEHMERI
jgi:hypothetical protein